MNATVDRQRLRFEEAVAALEQRLQLRGTASYRDLGPDEHARAFAVAGAMKADLLADLREAVQRAVEAGITLDEFRKAGRPELLATLEQEIAILMEYLPEQMSEAEVRTLVIQAVADAQAASAKDMGKVMALLMPKVKGRADGKLVNSIVKELLS